MISANGTSLLSRFVRNDKQAGLVMVVFGFLGFGAVNFPGTSAAYLAIAEFRIRLPLPHLDMTVSEWSQEGLLTLFFFIIGLDLRQEMATGFLKNPRNAVAPIFGAIGGVVLPVIMFMLINLSSPSTMGGWAIPTATDIAFSLTILSMVSSRTLPRLKAFLLTLATVDDVIGIILIAFVYSHPSSILPLLIICACLGIWFVASRMRASSSILLIFIAVGSWYAMLSAGIHPTLSGVAIGLLVPAKPLHEETTARAGRYRDLLSPLSALIALPIFAFFAMGIPLGDVGGSTLKRPLFLGIVVGLVIGKPLGVLIMTGLCGLAGFNIGGGTHLSDIVGVAQLCGIGFTVSFLISSLAFYDQNSIDLARLAVLVGSLLSCLLGSITIKIGDLRNASN